MMENDPLYNKAHPFLASIKERYSLSKTGSKKNTLHFVLDLEHSGLVYEVGDSVGIFPKHSCELVNKTLQAAKLTGFERITTKKLCAGDTSARLFKRKS